MPRRPGGGGGRRQLGRAGHRCSLPSSQTVHLIVREGPRQRHVALPGRPDRAQPQRRGAAHTEVRELVGENGRSKHSWSRITRPASAEARGARAVRLHRRAAPYGLARGRARARRPRLRPHRARGRRGTGGAGRRQNRICWRPAGPACSRRRRSAADRSSVWPPPSARARWPCGSCTRGSRTIGIPDIPHTVDRCPEDTAAIDGG